MSNSPREILGLDRAVALSLGAALVISVLAAGIVVSDPSTAARLSGWWFGSAGSNVWEQVWQQNVSAGGQGRALPGVSLVTQTPFQYRIEEGVSIQRQLSNWSLHEGWELDWEVYEAPHSATGMLDVSTRTPVDWRSARMIDFGQDFDRAFASVIHAMNGERRRRGMSPLAAIADFTTGRITVGLSEKQDHSTPGGTR